MAQQLVAWIFLLLSVGAAQAEPTKLENRLASHPSPYLALHGADPVAWQAWNADTVARAKRENKLLFVSVGYYACHWCHVMQRESYKNAEIAELLNREFIPVKVDRELHTGLDDALQEFSSRLLKISGWPLNAFVTPEGYPAYVVLYAPPEDFRKLSARLAERWKADSTGVKKLAQEANPPPTQEIQRQALNAAQLARWENAFLQQMRGEQDDLRGGFGEVSKFPMAPQLSLALELQAARPDAKLEGFLRLSFDQMAERGLRDHVNGGFFRYTTDPGWETPHFEKMLYDNAQLAVLYLRAAQVLKEPRYRAEGLAAVDFMLGVLAAPEGGFYASTSAVDDAGREGAHYLWDSGAIRRLLNAAEYAAARRVWKLDMAAPFELGYLPAEWATPNKTEKPLLRSALGKLERARRNQPLAKDDKRNAGLNGLALSALAAAMRAEPRYRKAAADTYRFVRTQMMTADGLYKSMAKGRKLAGAELEDYAYVARGLLDYAEAAGVEEARRDALRLAQAAWKQFADAQGWRREKQALLATVRPEAVLEDGPVASPSAVLIHASLRLGDAGLAARAREALQWYSPAMGRDPFSYPSQVLAYRQAVK
ncbi:thioredoxin domain-containing protein [Betaproteobacteria bacterium SCN2]|nr:thioredoxin domain-containing protein [Betaproteobacteria bacterium SCN2]